MYHFELCVCVCVNAGGLCGGCGMAAFQEVSGLEIVQKHLHRMVCHSSHFWAHQCCNHGFIQICYSVSPPPPTPPWSTVA